MILLTASESNGNPSWNSTPCLSLMSKVALYGYPVPLMFLSSQDSASPGTYAPVRSLAIRVSYIMPGGPYIALVFAGSIVSTSELIAITRTLPSSTLNSPAAHAPPTAAITNMSTITTAHIILLFGRAGALAGCAISLSGCFSELPTYFPPLRQDTGSSRGAVAYGRFSTGGPRLFLRAPSLWLFVYKEIPAARKPSSQESGRILTDQRRHSVTIRRRWMVCTRSSTAQALCEGAVIHVTTGGHGFGDRHSHALFLLSGFPLQT